MKSQRNLPETGFNLKKMHNRIKEQIIFNPIQNLTFGEQFHSEFKISKYQAF